MSDLVVDTDVVSFGFRQTDLFVRHYGPAIQGNRAVISFMTVAEIEYGMLCRAWGQARQDEMRAFLQKHYVRYGVTHRVCEAWAELSFAARQRGRVLQTADGWIAATAKALSIPLITHNAKDFDYLPGVKLVTFPAT